MKVAVIDLGTNTFHLLIVDVKAHTYDLLHKERRAVKIGEKGINQGEIIPQAKERAIQALGEFKEKINEYSADRVYATATSAIRNASNGKEVTQAIKEKSGIDIEIISGMREAELIYLGAKKAVVLGEEKSLIMDIGGGSVEFIIADAEGAYWMHSFEIGGQRLVEMFHKHDPISTQDIADLFHYLDDSLAPLISASEKYKPTTLVGCSGTFDTLSDILCEQEQAKRAWDATEYPLGIHNFQRIAQDIIKKERKERLAIPGMIDMRVDMIVVACLLVQYVIDRLDLKKLRVSAYALKEGILYNVLDTLQEEIKEK